MKSDMFVVSYDLETTDLYVTKGSGSIIQIGAEVIDLKRCQVVPGSELNVKICPNELQPREVISDAELKTLGQKRMSVGEYTRKYYPAIVKHAEWTKQKPDEFTRGLLDGMTEKEGFLVFLDHIKDQVKNSSRPIACGHNIVDFDNPIIDYYCKRYKQSYPFNKKENFDTLRMCWDWFRYSINPPPNFKLDTMREYGAFGLDSENAHDALKDVKDCSVIACRILSYMKRLLSNPDHALNNMFAGE